jgi:hypothetical protein
MLEALIHLLLFREKVGYGRVIPICFHCPNCGERDVRGEAWTETRVSRLIGLVETSREESHWVRGPCCDRARLSQSSPEVLALLDADAIEFQQLLANPLSPVRIVLLLAAFLCFFMPILGPAWLLLAWLPGGSYPPWFRWALRVCLLLHVIAINALAVLLIMEGK